MVTAASFMVTSLSLHLSVTPFSAVRFVPVNVSVELRQELCCVCVSMAVTSLTASPILGLSPPLLITAMSLLPAEKRVLIQIKKLPGALQMYVSVTPEVSQTTLDEMAGRDDTGHCPACVMDKYRKYNYALPSQYIDIIHVQ